MISTLSCSVLGNKRITFSHRHVIVPQKLLRLINTGAGTAAEIAAFSKANAAAIKVSAGKTKPIAAAITALKAEISEIDAWIARNYSNATADIVTLMDILDGTALADGGAVAGGSAHIAMDEEGGNVFGASTTLSGIGLSFSSKLEAHEEGQKKDRSNSFGLTYALGATWKSVEDGDQWGISAADGMTISASTNEGSDWAVSGSIALGGGAKVVGGVNYTESAYLGLSFAF